MPAVVRVIEYVNYVSEIVVESMKNDTFLTPQEIKKACKSMTYRAKWCPTLENYRTRRWKS